MALKDEVVAVFIKGTINEPGKDYMCTQVRVKDALFEEDFTADKRKKFLAEGKRLEAKQRVARGKKVDKVRYIETVPGDRTGVLVHLTDLSFPIPRIEDPAPAEYMVPASAVIPYRCPDPPPYLPLFVPASALRKVGQWYRIPSKDYIPPRDTRVMSLYHDDDTLLTTAFYGGVVEEFDSDKRKVRCAMC
jgi:hypothetical protein